MSSLASSTATITASTSAPLSVSKSASSIGGGNAASSSGAGAGPSSKARDAGDDKKSTMEGVSSPAELMGFVDTLLTQLEDKFQESSADVLERMTSMSTRIDSLESALSDILSGAIDEAPPGTAATAGVGRTPIKR